MHKKKYYIEQTDNGHLNTAINGIYSKLKIFENARILDIGCGAGYLGSYKPINPVSVSLYGLDIDKIAKQNIKHGYSNIVIKDIEANNYRLNEYKDNYFDFIIAKDFLEHLLKPWLLLPEFIRILKPGAKIWAQVPHYTSQLAWIDYTHVRPFTKQSLSMMFKDSGFIVESVKYNSLSFIQYPGVVDFLLNRLPLINHWAGNIEIIAVNN